MTADTATGLSGRTSDELKAAVDAVRGRLARASSPACAARVGLVLGTGLGSLAERIAAAVTVPYAEIPGMPPPGVEGHVGDLVVGELDGIGCAALRGRVHFYEGHSMAACTYGVRLLRALGADTLIVTNAAGGLNPRFLAGDAMVITDHIFLPGMAGFHPLRGPHDPARGERFPVMAGAYEPALADLAAAAAQAAGVRCHRGVYAMVAGPSYETGAEIRFLRAVGADAVGMSTCPEVVVARHAGMRVLALSLITNVVAPERPETSGHTHVLEAARLGALGIERIVRGALAALASPEHSG
jgi:purine-nucleoside phosphorylase